MNKNDNNTNIQELKNLAADFRDKRDWLQFHDPKNLAEAISIEAGELLELFLWQTPEQIADKLKNQAGFKEEVGDELADIINFCLNFSDVTGIDISEEVIKKLEKSEQKYPADKAKGVATKYTKL